MRIIPPLSATDKRNPISLFFFLPVVITLLGAFAIVKLSSLPSANPIIEASANSSVLSQGEPHNLPDVDNYFNIPYFINSEEITSTLVLNNNLPTRAEAEVTLFNLRGEPLKLPAFTLQPFSAERFNLAELTSESESNFSEGNIQIFYHAPMMTITSQVTMASTSKRISFESNESSTMDFHSNKLYGIIWLPDNDTKAEVALTNTATSLITIVAQAGGKNQTMTLGSRETQIISLREFIPKGSRAPQSILLTLGHDGAPGALIATGFAYNERNGFSTNLPFAERVTTKTKLLAGAHFRFGSAANNDEFPQGTTFKAPLVMANLDDLPVVAKVAVDYALDGISNRVSLGSIRLEPKQTKQIDLEKELARRNLNEPVDDAGIEITYTGKPGALMARLTSLDKSGDFAFDTPIKDPLAGSFRVSGNYPWRLDEGYNTVVHLKNTINKEAYAIVQIRYDGGDYNPEKIKLEPYETIALDIRKLRDAQEKDIRGEVMPLDVTSGQIIWYERTKESLIGRAETFVVADGLSSSFSCGGGGNCISFATSEMTPPSITTVAGSSGISYVPKYKERDCFNNLYGPYTVTGTINWSSTQQSVATVSGGSVTAIKGGTTTIMASWSTFVEACGMSCNPQPVTPFAAGVLVVQPQIISIKTGTVSQAARGVQGVEDISITINGKGFGTNVAGIEVMVAGTGIDVDVDAVAPASGGTQDILATFDIADNATPGNHAVTVKVGGQTSSPMNFYVQVPSRAVQDSISAVTTCDPTLCTIDDDPNKCGAYRTLTYKVVDQDGQAVESGGTVSEVVYVWNNENQVVIEKTRNFNENGIFGDTLGISGEDSNCLSNGASADLGQKFSVAIEGKSFDLTTRRRIQMNKMSGQYTITVSTQVN